ncbi:DUF2254 domain-containing protein [Paracoccus sp. TK19116]|uniref:DUF2254 domain-containing protein n=1 Tax=Paracoccus albicereus TaxID=2922394 RepID=A0ABT1MT17_9RHOB|nr:DUF2254 domain-containing protein [Paracoccus albicereus]MCQ0970864.1 DUF2254 domain-containing protein [Paracoccus albicereus]
MAPTDSKLLFRLKELSRRMWVRVTAFSLGGIFLALIASFIGRYVPYIPKVDLASGSVDSILNIIASSMLAVTTFSVSIMVQAYGSATSNATPRATRLLADDSSAQNAVAVFIGSFLFSIVGIIGIAAGLYQDQARVVLFFATLGVIATIAITLLNWFNHLNDFGRVRDIVVRIEAEAMGAAEKMRLNPIMGANPLPSPLGDIAPILGAETSGYVRYLDIDGLAEAADEAGLRVEIRRMPGKYVHEGEALLRLSATPDDKTARALRKAFVIGTTRSFEQDLGYGLIVLSEVASRALSPAVNDPGTAIEVLRAGTRVLQRLHIPHTGEEQEAAVKPHIHAPPFEMEALYQTFFWPIARDGKGLVEVQETLIDCLSALEGMGGGAAARQMILRARERSYDALSEWERERLG